MDIDVLWRSVKPLSDSHRARLTAGFTKLEAIDESRCEFLVQTKRPDAADLSAEIRAVCDQLRAEGTRANNPVQYVMEVRVTRSPVHRRARPNG